MRRMLVWHNRFGQSWGITSSSPLLYSGWAAQIHYSNKLLMFPLISEGESLCPLPSFPRKQISWALAFPSLVCCPILTAHVPWAHLERPDPIGPSCCSVHCKSNKINSAFEQPDSSGCEAVKPIWGINDSSQGISVAELPRWVWICDPWDPRRPRFFPLVLQAQLRLHRPSVLMMAMVQEWAWLHMAGAWKWPVALSAGQGCASVAGQNPPQFPILTHLYWGSIFISHWIHCLSCTNLIRTHAPPHTCTCMYTYWHTIWGQEPCLLLPAFSRLMAVLGT